ncbi:MAG: hypothetical protein LQ350_003435 [Teloschistes chrysophthalmus]|nr:MAG: hypothetical protein LQ350_003435 [Niorma chrysophthalma]
MSAFVAIESRSHFSQSKVGFEFTRGLLMEWPIVHADQRFVDLESGPYFSQSKTELLMQRTPTVDEEVEPVIVKLPSIRRRNHKLLPFDEEHWSHFSQSKTDLEPFDERIWDDGVENERIHVRLPFAGEKPRSLFAWDNPLEGSNDINISTHIPMENSLTFVDLDHRNEDRRTLTTYELLGPRGLRNGEHSEREKIRAVLNSSGLPAEYWGDQSKHLVSLEQLVQDYFMRTYGHWTDALSRLQLKLAWWDFEVDLMKLPTYE